MNDKERSIDALKMFKELIKKKISKRDRDTFRTGTMVAFSYDAKNKDVVYDKSPLIISLGSSKSYVLGLNFHWSPNPARKILIDYILKLNKDAIRNNKPLVVKYRDLKHIIIKLKLKYVIRLYIKSRISPKVLVIPHEYFMKAVYLPAENFSHGMSANKLYKLAVRNATKRRSKRAKKKG